MLMAMRDLALLELNRRFGSALANLGEIRRRHAADLAQLLLEAPGKVSRVYLLQAVPQRPGAVRMWVEEVTSAKARRLPFNRPSGSQSGAIGPVFKRSFKPAAHPPYGPTSKIQETTRKDFLRLSQGDTAWSAYFSEVYEVLFGGRVLEYGDERHETGERHDHPHPLAAAMSLIPDKETVFVSVVDAAGRWPGDSDAYQAYLAQVLAEMKYLTSKAPARPDGSCPLCGSDGVSLYPNALKGAGINFSNMDRVGAFPGLDPAQAWKGYALCLDCADLLYIFKFHLMDGFIGRVAGKKALLLPAVLGNPKGRGLFMRDWGDYVGGLDGHHVQDLETDLMEFFAGRDDAHLILNILWARFGQLIEDCHGYLTDILPSRLQALTRLNAAANAWDHPLAPRHAVNDAGFDLSLSCLDSLLHRPGGRAATGANQSPQLFALKRDLANALYHGLPLADAKPLWTELFTTAGWYLRVAADQGNPWGLILEGIGKNGVPYLTLAGWTRHLARFLHYLDRTGILPMTDSDPVFEPRMQALTPYFTRDSGIDSREMAFAFLLGVLYGKLLQVQGARGVNVTSNALTWLKRLKLAGRDLPELYIKVREKLLSYSTEASPRIRELLAEIGRLGTRVGDRIDLDNTATCYFLLLGQSVSLDVLPTSEKEPHHE